MSLHAQLSPDAEKKLANQQRNSTISSILIAVLVMIFIGVVFMKYFLPEIYHEAPNLVAIYAPELRDEEHVSKTPINRIQSKPFAPSRMLSKTLYAQKASRVSLPVVDDDAIHPSTELGAREEGLGIGLDEFGEGGGDPYVRIPDDFRQRCSQEDRMHRLTSNGGNEQCEEAVLKSLRWLKKTQNKDGSWSDRNQVAMTGFALLVYLGRCETPNSEEFGDAVTRAIIYLVNVSMKNEGKIADDFQNKHWCYDHAIGTYALGEATTFCNSLGISVPNLQAATKMAGDWILEHQHSSGSWDYGYNQSSQRGGDNSIGLWHIQALKACKQTGLWEGKVFTRVIRKALRYVKNQQAPSGGIGYASPKPNSRSDFTMTGGGMLAYQIWGEGHDALVRKGSRYIKNHAKFDFDTENADLYRHYYYAQAMMNRGGEEWDNYNDIFRDQLLKNQNQDGTWKAPYQGKKLKAVAASYQGQSRFSVHYRTCLAALMLEVYYRYLPATGRRE